jgi:hypothetical protein
MSSATADLFVEDRAHEEFVKGLLIRLAEQEQVSLVIQIRSARGGHAKALDELSLYQRALFSAVSGLAMPDILVVAIDANCNSFATVRRAIEERIDGVLKDRAIIACPDPHVERWYLADPDSFTQVVGVPPDAGARKCERDLYKDKLARAIARAGHPPTLGGIEFARELVEAMDLYRAGKLESSLKHFVDDAEARLRQTKGRT